MKYRIRQYKNRSGEDVFVPEYKDEYFGRFWFAYDSKEMSTHLHTPKVQFNTLEKAKYFLKIEIEFENQEIIFHDIE